MTKPPLLMDYRKENEIRTLAMLRKDARMKLIEMARQLNISTASMFTLFRRTTDNYVTKYSSLVDFEKLGYFVGSLFIMKIPQEERKKEALLGFLSCSRAINSLNMTKNSEFIAEAYFRNMAEFVDFRHLVDEFAEDVVEHEIVGEIVKEKFCNF